MNKISFGFISVTITGLLLAFPTRGGLNYKSNLIPNYAPHFSHSLETPASYNKITTDSRHNYLKRIRFDQIAIPNESYRRYQTYLVRHYPNWVRHPGAPRPATLSAPPPQELILEFKEKWTWKPAPGKKQVAHLHIHNLTYENNRHLAGYHGTIKNKTTKIDFSISIQRHADGNIRKLEANLKTSQGPPEYFIWEEIGPLTTSESLRDFQNTLPVPLFAGPSLTPRRNGSEQTPFVFNPEKLPLKKQNPPIRPEKQPLTALIQAGQSLVTSALRLIGSLFEDIMNLPVVPEIVTGIRLTLGVVTGIFSGDLFSPAAPITFDPAGPAVLTIGGIRTNTSQSKQFNSFIKEKFDIKTATFVQNDSFFFGVADLIQVLAHDYLGAIDKPARTTAQALIKGVNDKGAVYVVLHSQGAGIFKQSLHLVPPELKSKIHVLTLGAQMYIDKKTEGLGSTTNIQNSHDIVPKLARLKIITNNLFPWNWGRLKNDTVYTLESPGPRGPIKSHLIKSYHPAINEWISQARHNWAQTQINFSPI